MLFLVAEGSQKLPEDKVAENSLGRRSIFQNEYLQPQKQQFFQPKRFERHNKFLLSRKFQGLLMTFESKIGSGRLFQVPEKRRR